MGLDPKISELLSAARTRREQIEKLHREAQADVKTLLPLLKGARYRRTEAQQYEIFDVFYGWGGLVHAKGYKIVKNGKRGSKVWDIGAINLAGFEGV